MHKFALPGNSASCRAAANTSLLAAMIKGPRKNNRNKRPKRHESARAAGGPDQIFGLHAASAALLNPLRDIKSVVATENAALKLEAGLLQRGIKPRIASAGDISGLLGGDTVHQGVLVEAAPLPDGALEDILAGCGSGAGAGPVVVLDQVTDPHNVGAVLRSAAAFGAAGIVMTIRHSPPLDGVLAKAASGAMEHVPVARVTNLARALEQIGDAGLMRIGLDSDAEGLLEENGSLGGACALVLGSEDKGLRRLTRENCDSLARITTQGAIASLNISNAGAIALHACLIARRRQR